MIKITQDTELKEEMKIKLNEMILIIHEIETTPGFTSFPERDRLTLWRDVKGSDTFVVVTRKFLIENKAELIEDNAKVVVSELIASKLEKSKKESIEIDCGNFTVHSFAWKFLGKLSNDDISKEELSFKKIVKICEGTTFDKNGWEIEKPKKWYRVFITMAGDAIVAEDKDEMSTPRESHINNGNDFKTHEDAQIVADKINSILRGEE